MRFSRTASSSTILLLLLGLNNELEQIACFSPARGGFRSESLRAVDLANTHLSAKVTSNEDAVRSEIEQRNTNVPDEDKYSIPDGNNLAMSDEGFESLMTPPPGGGGAAEENSISPEQLERALRPRAYPLFMMEKAALLVEDVLSSFKGNEGTARSGALKSKGKVVVLGTGWGSAAFLKDVDVSKYDVTVVSPRNFFLFTPMLAGASVGTVEYRSITEPVREINSKAAYLEGTATNIDPDSKTITCEAVSCQGNSCTMEEFSLTYDKLVYAVGAQTNTFGIPGVFEYCNFLKQVEDAKQIRTSIVNLFERANLPGLSEETKRSILTFAVIGAGPTGIEFASELRDFIENDGPKYYPKLLKYVRIKVIEASSSILAPFDKSLQDEAVAQLTRRVSIKDPTILGLLPEDYKLTELLLDSGVSEVKKNVICLNNGQEVPYGLAVWAAGNGPLPVTLNLIESLGDNSTQAATQSTARGRLAVDSWLRVLGAENEIFSLGDCSCVAYGPPLPATAQVAAQQGEYLARLLNDNVLVKGEGTPSPPVRDGKRERTPAESITAFAMQNEDIVAPFQFLNLGILAYTGGGSALAQFQVTPNEKGMVKGKGKVGYGLWRSVYLTKQVSWRNRFLVFTDWLKTNIFGRDITRV